MADRPRELDVVELQVPVDGWPAGFRATVLEVADNGLLLDVDADVSDRGLMDHIVTASPADVRIVVRAAATTGGRT